MLKGYFIKICRTIFKNFLNFYYACLPLKEINIDELIYPHRLDIQLRVDFLLNYVINNNIHTNRSPYYEFLQNLKKHSYYIKDIDENKLIEKFIDLYYSIKKNGLDLNNFEPIIVEKVSPKLRFIYPNDGKLIEGIRSNNKFILREGAHRLAILKVLNYSKVYCKLSYSGKDFTSDYTTFIESYNNQNDN